ncbi:MAG: hypothetical protein K0S78_699 [Thermomicrobiales bacterium]|jgi:hypothetical protein|nr:hypothetical protein [Thermomicrobiales bacterium]
MRGSHLKPLLDRAESVDPKAVVMSGLAAGAVFVAVLEADLRLTGRNVDDLTILGRPFVADARRARVVGGLIHAVNSVGLAGLYALVEPRLPGPPWWKGVLFANAENLILYPITVFEDHHPAVRDGLVDRYFTWPAFWQSVPRHVAYGAVLGVLYDRLRARW